MVPEAAVVACGEAAGSDEVQVVAEPEPEHSRLSVEAPETMLRWQGVQAVAEQVELRFRPIHPIPRGVDRVPTGTSRSVTSTSPANN